MGSEEKKFRHFAVIVAGGKGLRMKSDRKKQYLVIDKVPVLIRSLLVFDHHPRVDEIILVVPETDMTFCRDTLIAPFNIATPLHLISGGITRQNSVTNGLDKIITLCGTPKETLVLVHDGVRPFVEPDLVDACLDKAAEVGACIPALAITDTIKKSMDGRQITNTLDRSLLYRAQTPQVFRLDLLLSAITHAKKTGFSGTDEASMLEHAGIPVHLVPGNLFNIKLTTRGDLDLAEFLLDRNNKTDCS